MTSVFVYEKIFQYIANTSHFCCSHARHHPTILTYVSITGIQIVNPQFNEISLIQNFIRVADDKTPWEKLPLGLRLDPRTSNIVLNGRPGQIQFYSPHDSSVFNVSKWQTNRKCVSKEIFVCSLATNNHRKSFIVRACKNTVQHTHNACGI